MENLGSYLQGKIKEKKAVKTLIAKEMQVTRQGLDKMMDNESITVNKYLHLCRLIDIDPCDFLNQGSDKVKKLPEEQLSDYDKNKEVDTETKEFYEGQISSLTRIIENLSEVVKSDTSINGNVTS